jgi:HEPN domain-containing protein
MGLLRRSAGRRESGQGSAPASRSRELGHVVARGLRELPTAVRPPESLVAKAQVLDTAYIPSRYPNSHPEGAPFEHYGPIQSEEALQFAGEIIEFVRLHLA